MPCDTCSGVERKRTPPYLVGGRWASWQLRYLSPYVGKGTDHAGTRQPSGTLAGLPPDLVPYTSHPGAL